MTKRHKDIPHNLSPLEEAIEYGDDEYIEEYQRKLARLIREEKKKKKDNPYR